MAELGSMQVSTYFKPSDWALCSLGCWTSYVALRGWHSLGVWDKRQVAFAVFTALLFLNFLTYEEFEGWSDVYYFCGSKLQYCTCNFKWNMRGWLKAYILWSFILTSAAGLQRLLIQVGLNGLLPGEEVVTRESIISICWRLIPYWLNNWEQQWGAECSSMMFELPHFAVELLVILPCIQILCARLKVLVMPLVHMGHLTAMNAAPQAAPAAAAPAAQQPAGHAAAGARAGRAARGRHGLGVPRRELAPNVLRGYWEHKPEQQRLLPRLRANAQVMCFAVVVTALAASNALLVPLMLESTVSQHPVSMTIQMAGRHPEWFTNSTLNTSAISTANLTASQTDLLASRLASYHIPRPPLLPQQPSFAHWMHAYHTLYNQTRLPAFELGSAGSGVHVLAQPILNTLRQLNTGALLPLKERLMTTVAHFWLGKDMYDLLRSAARSLHAGSNTSSNDQPASVGSSSADQLQKSGADAGSTRHATQPGHPPADEQHHIGATDASHVAATSGTVIAGAQQAAGSAHPQACAGRIKNFKNNLAKHAEEITKMQAQEHRSLIPLVESALAVMRLSCEKYFVLLSVFAAHLVFRENPPHAVRLLIRLNARLSTVFQKVILYSFPAVCWVYGAGFMFSMFVSFVFWGGPIMATYESVRVAITVVRIKSLRPANEEALERMGGNCTICWGEMHVGQPPTPQPAEAAGGAVAGAQAGGAGEPQQPAPPVAAPPAAVAADGDAGGSRAQGQKTGPAPSGPQQDGCSLAVVDGADGVTAVGRPQSGTAASAGPSVSTATGVVGTGQAVIPQTAVVSSSSGIAGSMNFLAAPAAAQQPEVTPARVGSSPALMQQQAAASSTQDQITAADSGGSNSRRVCSLDMPAGATSAVLAGTGTDLLEGSMQQPGGTAVLLHPRLQNTQQQQQQQQQQANGSISAATTAAAQPHPSHSSVAAIDSSTAMQEQAINEEDRAWSLPCGHAYHHACLSQWLSQCHTNGVVPTCPMCQARIQLEVRWRVPIPWHPPPDDLRAAGQHHRAGAAGEAGDGQRRPHREDTDDEDEDGDAQAGQEIEEVGEVIVPRVAVVGLGRQRPAGRVRAANGRIQAHENLLLPPPLAALGGMSMLRLLEHQREIQELLADMPQIAPPEDVEQLQLLAAENQALLLPQVLDFAGPAQQQPQQDQAAIQPQQQQPAQEMVQPVRLVPIEGRQASQGTLQLQQHADTGIAAQASGPSSSQQQATATTQQQHTTPAVPARQGTAQGSSIQAPAEDLHSLAERLSTMPAAELAALLQERKVMQALKDAAAVAASGGSSSRSAGSRDPVDPSVGLSLQMQSCSEASLMPWLAGSASEQGAGPSRGQAHFTDGGSCSQKPDASASETRSAAGTASMPAPAGGSSPGSEERNSQGRRRRKARRNKDTRAASAHPAQGGTSAAAPAASNLTAEAEGGVASAVDAPAAQGQGPRRRLWRLFQRSRQPQ